MARVVCLALLVCFVRPGLGFAQGAPSPFQVTIPSPESEFDRRYPYYRSVLKLALDKSVAAFGAYRLVVYPVSMNQERALWSIESNQGVDVWWSVTTQERETRLRPIRFPLTKGLIGYRVLIVRRANRADFGAITRPEELGRFRCAQGVGWPDVRILKFNGIKVHVTPSYEGLFEMLARGRVDYVPRGVTEVWGELAAHRALDLAAEPRLLLRYLGAVYFFVRRDADELAARIENGLERALADGSFDANFQIFHGEGLRRAAIGTRRVIELRNPFFPKAAPLGRPELWYEPPTGGP